MKVLAVSDQIDERIYTPQVRERFGDVDLVVGCGDLAYEYLEFLVSALNKPLLYVPGNHDPLYQPGLPDSRAEGCVFLDQQVRCVKGLLIAGMGGSIRYHPTRVNQYTQAQMYLRMVKIAPALLWQQLRYRRSLDILIAHSPPRGIHDEDDRAHIGFSAFTDFIRIFKPRYFLHGHTLPMGNLAPRITRVGATTVINVYSYHLVEVEPS